MKVICAGLSKTGTKTLAKALRILGYTVYDYFEHESFHANEWLAILCEGKDPDFIAMYRDVDAVTDLPAADWFQEIYEAFPDAKVILSLRDNEEVWVKSFSKQVEILKTYGGFVNRVSLLWLRPILGVISAPSKAAETWKKSTFVQLVVRVCYGSFNSKSTSLFKKKYREHNERVQAVIPKERLLIYNVKQGWKPLCKFLECDVPEEEFPRENVALSITHQAISAELEEVKRKLFVALAICANKTEKIEEAKVQLDKNSLQTSQSTDRKKHAGKG